MIKFLVMVFCPELDNITCFKEAEEIFKGREFGSDNKDMFIGVILGTFKVSVRVAK